MFIHIKMRAAFLGSLLLINSAAIASDTTTASNNLKAAHFVQKLSIGKKQLVVTYGTSLTHGGYWVQQLSDLLNELYPGLATVQNSGESAKASDWGLDNIERRLLCFKPDAVFMEFAINDAYLPYNISLKQCRDNLVNMIAQIKKINPDCDIILLTLSLPTREHFDHRPQFEEYYNVYRDVAIKNKLMFIDTFPAWKTVLFSSPDRFYEYVPDGIHPSSDGCKNVSWPVIRAAILGNMKYRL